MDEILNLIESVSEGFPSFFFYSITYEMDYLDTGVRRMCWVNYMDLV